jgi:uncharacterized protein YidB (DUF937 family)
MKLLDSIAGEAAAALVGLAGNSPPGMLNEIANLVSGRGDTGLEELLAKFQSKGLNNEVASWVGTGANLPVTSDQLQSVLGSEQLRSIAQRLGLSPEAASNMLASMFPQVINHLTPSGQLPVNETLQQCLAQLKSLSERA